MNIGGYRYEPNIAPLELTAMTLRGIGPYFMPARLEFAPITVLCGENGSGKSTWFKVLKILCDSCNSDYFPYCLDSDDLPTIDYTKTISNATIFRIIDEGLPLNRICQSYIDKLITGYNTKADRSNLSKDYVLIEIEATINSSFSIYGKKQLEQTEDTAINLIKNGTLIAGGKIKLQITLDPGELNSWDGKYEKINKLSLIYNDETLFQIQKEYSEFLNIFICTYCGEDNKNKNNSTVLEIGIENINNEKIIIKGTSNINGARQLYFDSINTFKKIMNTIGEGFFFLSGARSSLDEVDWDYSENWKSNILPSRYVGKYGTNSYSVNNFFYCNNIIEYGNFDKDLEIIKEIEEIKQEKRDIIAKYEKELNIQIKDEESLINILNSDRNKYPILKNMKPSYMDFLMLRSIEARCKEASLTYQKNTAFYKYQAYIAYYLSNFFNINIRKHSPERIKHNPTGIIYSKFSDLIDKTNNAGQEYQYFEYERNIFKQGALAIDSEVNALSSLAYNIYPMVVQTGVMWPGEIFAIESPEAQLHPSMQIKLTEYFMAHVTSGRNFALETHSDLMVRRLLRAILEEEVTQSDVKIYFTRLETPPLQDGTEIPQEVKDTIKSSFLEEIKINEKGQIANWPKGFLDVDILESQRLIDAMYGAMLKEKDSNDESS